MSVVKTVASQLGLASPNTIKPSTLTRDVEVAWFMEVIGNRFSFTVHGIKFFINHTTFANIRSYICILMIS